MPKCKDIYLLGSDVENSLSDKLHMSLYGYLGLNFNYIKKSISDKKTLDNFISKVLLSDFFAANVTYPYKNYVYKKLSTFINCDKVSESSESINLFCGPKLSLYNYDGVGLVKFMQYQNLLNTSSKVCIFGSGATARSIGFALCDFGVKSITLLSRQKVNCKKIKKLPLFLNSDIKIKQYSLAQEDISKSNILIDATPVFLLSNKSFYNELIFPDTINKDQILIDVSYKNNDEALMKYKKSFNIVYDGRGMLVSQAILCILQICKNYKIDLSNKANYEDMLKVGFRALDIHMDDKWGL